MTQSFVLIIGIVLYKWQHSFFPLFDKSRQLVLTSKLLLLSLFVSLRRTPFQLLFNFWMFPQARKSKRQNTGYAPPPYAVFCNLKPLVNQRRQLLNFPIISLIKILCEQKKLNTYSDKLINTCRHARQLPTSKGDEKSGRISSSWQPDIPDRVVGEEENKLGEGSRTLTSCKQYQTSSWAFLNTKKQSFIIVFVELKFIFNRCCNFPRTSDSACPQ